MKYNTKLKGFVLILTLLLSYGCEKNICETHSTSCGTYELCMESTQYWFIYNGKEYYCNGTNCDDAIVTLTDDMCNP
jgi:hypothetical protein